MRNAYDSAAVYAAEAALMQDVPADSLMATAAQAVAAQVIELLQPGLTSARIVVITGAGNNGGDALFAGAVIAGRGATVTAVTVADSWHTAGADALLAAGGRLLAATDSGAAEAVRAADLVIDGIVGIGASGAIRPPAVDMVRLIRPDTWVVAVDVPSGVDPSTGVVADPDAVISADVTVTFGVCKAAQFLPPGSDRYGVPRLVDIGLGPAIESQQPRFSVLDTADATEFFAAPGVDDYKYSHGVLGVVAGCGEYPGAPHMVVGSARHSGTGMVRLWQDPTAPEVATAVVMRFPDTVCAREVGDDRATAWTVGPGMGVGDDRIELVAVALATQLPVVVDADALTLVSRSEELRRAIQDRSAPTVLTPHVGEFTRLGFTLTDDRLADARNAAAQLDAVVLLKGPGTVIADPEGAAFVDIMGPAALATAGTGDALSGIIGAVLSRHPTDVPKAVAAAVLVHGLAARFASQDGRPMTAWDLVGAIPDAVVEVRSR